MPSYVCLFVFSLPKKCQPIVCKISCPKYGLKGYDSNILNLQIILGDDADLPEQESRNKGYMIFFNCPVVYKSAQQYKFHMCFNCRHIKPVWQGRIIKQSDFSCGESLMLLGIVLKCRIW